ncbi:hypothetical protein [Aeromonas hydrophila]|uniref:hypothetical protein n=1 Tax=Aeromonas hydrophila TaxID=644 RepID=UPI0011174B3F|nr:hypothetical protein [Aeromonas hydrophila]
MREDHKNQDDIFNECSGTTQEKSILGLPKKMKRGPAKKLNDSDVKSAVGLYLSGEYSLQVVGDHYGVSVETIRLYVNESKRNNQ